VLPYSHDRRRCRQETGAILPPQPSTGVIPALRAKEKGGQLALTSPIFIP